MKPRKLDVIGKCREMKVKAFRILARKAIEQEDIIACESIIRLAEIEREEEIKLD